MATNLQKNMYVRCPFDREYPRSPRDFITGQIQEIDEIADIALVKFMDPFNFRAYYDKIPAEPIECPIQLLSHVTVYKDSYVIYKKERYRVVSTTQKEGWNYYYIQNDMSNESLSVREDSVIVPFNIGKASPMEQLRRYEFQNPVWYMGRSVVSKTIKILENSVYGFKELAGCKIYLMPHQLNTIMRCLQDKTCRFMLADEVGMGKTIEAAAVLKIFLLHNANKQILIAVPGPLVEQWKTELFIKFEIEEGIDKKKNRVSIVPVDEIGLFMEESWDFLIIDEVHKILGKNKLYDACHTLSRNSQNVLLLSATPVQQKEGQYLDLLRLILPNKYDGITLDSFKEQVSRQKKITRAMCNMLADFDDLSESIDNVMSKEENIQDDDDCAGIYDDIIGGLEDIKELIQNDDFLDSLVDDIPEEVSLEGKARIQEIVIYICDNYQLEYNILRNRRGLISSAMAVRDVYELGYQLDPDRNTYEAATYEAFVDWVTGQQLEADDFIRFYIPLLEAFFSSSWAFNAELDRLEKNGLYIAEEVEAQAKEWLREENELIPRVKIALLNPKNYSNRLIGVMHYLTQVIADKKVVLFTNHEETFEKYSKALIHCFEEGRVALFNKRLDSDDLELNIYRFQNDPDCRILICDESGGEGRNLQIADAVLHIDLPWDANVIEQRIGRLDRLGRSADRTVMSVVVHTNDTLESELFRFWRDGLKVFNKSLSGLEIIMNEINHSIISAVTDDFRYGISNAIEEVVQASQKMEQDVREERLFDTASFIYGNLNQQLKVTLEKYHSNENQLFAGSMMGWATLAGFKGMGTNKGTTCFSEKSFSVGSAVKSLFIPPRWEDYISKTSNSFSRHIQDLYDQKQGRRQTNTLRTLEGTFDRELAIKNDYLHFFAPGDEVFDSITNNALRSDKGQCAAFMFKTDIDWKGFIFTFALEPNAELLLENSIPITAIGRFKSYIAMDQIVVPVPFDAFADIPVEKVVSRLERLTELPALRQKREMVHFGKRLPSNDFLHIKLRYNISNFEWFTNQYPEETWEEYVKIAHKKAVDIAKKRFGKSSSLKSATKEVDRMMSTEIAKSRYYGTAPAELDKIRDRYMLIIEALRKSKIVTESAAFVWMVNTNER